MHRILPAALAALALAACGPSAPKKSGTPVATGTGIVITNDEFKAKLEEQAPYMRARFSTLERKKELLDQMVRDEVLAREAEKQGIDKDPEVQKIVRRVMVQKLVTRTFGDASASKDVPDADVQAYFDAHKDEFQKPKKVRLSGIVFLAAAGSPDVAKKSAAAKKLVPQLQADEKSGKNRLAFTDSVARLSEDAPSKAGGGDLGFKARDEWEKALGKEVAEAAFALKPTEIGGPYATPQGLVVLKVTGVQEELNRTLEQAKPQIAQKIYREKRTKEFNDMIKKLIDDAKVTVDDKVLEAVAVPAAPAGGPPGMPGMPGGMGGMGGGSPHGAPGAPPANPPGR